MTASQNTRVRSNNSVSQNRTHETDPLTHQVVQFAIQRDEVISSDDIETTDDRLLSLLTEYRAWRRDRFDKHRVDDEATLKSGKWSRETAPIAGVI